MYRREPWFCQMDIMYSAQIIKIKLERGNQSIHLRVAANTSQLSASQGKDPVELLPW